LLTFPPPSSSLPIFDWSVKLRRWKNGDDIISVLDVRRCRSRCGGCMGQMLVFARSKWQVIALVIFMDR
jgi:hypothetical protein